jgi:hypothetical protein
VPRVFAALEQARESVRAAAAGYQDQLRIALSDGLTPLRFAAMTASGAKQPSRRPCRTL